MQHLCHCLHICSGRYSQSLIACVACGMSGADDMEDSDESAMEVVPSSLTIAKNLGVDAPHIQLQKASFFAANDDDDDVGDDNAYLGYIKHKGRLWAVLLEVGVAYA